MRPFKPSTQHPCDVHPAGKPVDTGAVLELDDETVDETPVGAVVDEEDTEDVEGRAVPFRT